jgi:threonine aldolase
MMVYDLRSDFLSPAPAGSVEAMAKAAAHPHGFGLREDPEQEALERDVARLLGKEDALLVPTCTMANLVACAAQIKPGDAVVAEATSHCILSEAGGIAAVAGGLVMPLPGQSGAMNPDDLRALLIRGHDAQRPRIALVIAETTHNR